MTKLADIVTFLDGLLQPPPGLADSSNNGLQVEGARDVRRVVFGVDACAALFEAAAEHDAQLVIVHHGMSWGPSFRRLQGVTARRLDTLFKNGISLYASHLPLDLHPEVGHNARLAALLGLTDTVPFHEYGGVPIGVAGQLPQALTLPELRDRINGLLQTECVLFPGHADRIRRLGIVSGGAGDAAEDAARAGCDALLTGEITHSHYHYFRETGLTGIAAGHYRTEIPGLTAVMDRLAAAFPGLPCEWIDLPTGL